MKIRGQLIAAKGRGVQRLFACCLLLFSALLAFPPAPAATQSDGPVLLAEIKGPINPAVDDYLKGALQYAKQRQARLLVINLDTPGGLLTSMQSMVEGLLESPVPTAVYVSPSGAGATSAGVFITLAANIAAMAPTTTIGAAHPVLGTGGDVEGKMGEKVENLTASLIRAISEQRGRNAQWAERAVRESVAITEREALEQKVIDVVALSLDDLLKQLEERKVKTVNGEVTLQGLAAAPREHLPMSFKQKVVNILSDPNIAILLGLGAMLGIGIELYHPGAIFPGIFGAICLVLSLTAAQVLPITLGGAALLLLSAVFFTVEMFMPSFGIWGASGIVCLVLGAIYFIDPNQVWSGSEFGVNRTLVGTIAGVVGAILLGVIYLALNAGQRKVTTSSEGMLGRIGTVKVPLTLDAASGLYRGKVELMGEFWWAETKAGREISAGEKVRVAFVDGLRLVVEPAEPGSAG